MFSMPATHWLLYIVPQMFIQINFIVCWVIVKKIVSNIFFVYATKIHYKLTQHNIIINAVMEFFLMISNCENISKIKRKIRNWLTLQVRVNLNEECFMRLQTNTTKNIAPLTELSYQVG